MNINNYQNINCFYYLKSWKSKTKSNQKLKKNCHIVLMTKKCTI